MATFGSPEYRETKNNLIFNTNVCHNGDKFKLYYYKDTKYFHCYTDCNCNYSIYDLIQKNTNCDDFFDAIEWLSDYINYRPEFNESSIELIGDWEWLKKYSKKKYNQIELKTYDEKLLELYYKLPHKDLLDEGINCEVQNKFGIRFDLHSERIIYPAYSQKHEFLGAKGRILKKNEPQEDKYIGVLPYNKSHVLWGLQVTYPYIQETHKLIIYEGEKSVLKSYQYGYPFCCAIGGHDLSDEQAKQCINLASEVIIALDKGVEINENTGEKNDVYQKIINKLKPFVKVSIIYDKWNVLDNKDAPCDKGGKILRQLYNKRFYVE